ncbi:growth-regulating factor 7-like [Lotus japonicus]|uniref:growth-regulating factor 7-like n=1 Tax=Lotus japonicus TaxID=34305 RepID=UPI0025892ECC|nr:growth-regulating factor 7-like [Lotus japonicus]
MEEGGVVDEGNTVIMDKGQKSSSIVELDLRVGAYSTPQQEAINPVISGPFTETQRRELHHQVKIFNHFANNLPLPPHVVQCFASGCNHPYLNDRNSIESEPGNCRRIDG